MKTRRQSIAATSTTHPALVKAVGARSQGRHAAPLLAEMKQRASRFALACDKTAALNMVGEKVQDVVAHESRPQWRALVALPERPARAQPYGANVAEKWVGEGWVERCPQISPASLRECWHVERSGGRAGKLRADVLMC